MIDAQSDVCKKVVVNAEFEVWGLNLLERSLSATMEVMLGGRAIVQLAGEVIETSGEIFAEVCVIAVVITLTFWKMVVSASASYSDFRMLAGSVFDTKPCIGVNMFDSGDASVRASTKTAPECVPMPAS